MLKLPTYPVNRVKYDGPTSYRAIISQIAEDAKKAGKDHITRNIVESVIPKLFTQRTGLYNVSFYQPAYIRGLGRWLPNKAKQRQFNKYIENWKKYRSKFSNQLRLCRNQVNRMKTEYAEYKAREDIEIKVSYLTWKRASGWKRKVDASYRKLNKIRSDFMKYERKLGFAAIREVKRKYKSK